MEVEKHAEFRQHLTLERFMIMIYSMGNNGWSGALYRGGGETLLRIVSLGSEVTASSCLLCLTRVLLVCLHKLLSPCFSSTFYVYRAVVRFRCCWRQGWIFRSSFHPPPRFFINIQKCRRLFVHRANHRINYRYYILPGALHCTPSPPAGGSSKNKQGKRK